MYIKKREKFCCGIRMSTEKLMTHFVDNWQNREKNRVISPNMNFRLILYSSCPQPY